MHQSTHTPEQKTVTVVLSGTVSKGAFEVGALKVLADQGIAVRRIVAVSSGALNGTAYAAGVRARREKAAAEEMATFWQTYGGIRDILHINFLDILSGRGLSDQDKLLAMLRTAVKPSRNDWG
jgi:predicted acylesterase/phospholipase RssA